MLLKTRTEEGRREASFAAEGAAASPVEGVPGAADVPLRKSWTARRMALTGAMELIGAMRAACRGVGAGWGEAGAQYYERCALHGAQWIIAPPPPCTHPLRPAHYLIDPSLPPLPLHTHHLGPPHTALTGAGAGPELR